MQKAFQTLETNVQRKNTMLRQILQPITKMNDNIEMSDQSSQETKTVQPLQKNDTAVGFTTKLSGSYSSTSSNIRGSPILYNGGNAYNGTVFTCPSPGLYLFHVSMITSTELGGIWIYKNSQQLTLAWAGVGDPQWNGASVSAAVWLDVGDQVYLRPHGSTLRLDSNSAFTGVKLS
ncbi:complement C1q-like protein 4 [Crassostrea virginica]